MNRHCDEAIQVIQNQHRKGPPGKFVSFSGRSLLIAWVASAKKRPRNDERYYAVVALTQKTRQGYIS